MELEYDSGLINVKTSLDQTLIASITHAFKAGFDPRYSRATLTSPESDVTFLVHSSLHIAATGNTNLVRNPFDDHTFWCVSFATPMNCCHAKVINGDTIILSYIFIIKSISLSSRLQSSQLTNSFVKLGCVGWHKSFQANNFVYISSRSELWLSV